ncbi:DUF1566 domain-containing protein [bacterium]|nr:DUF1566 domain-containing protein [bacterium]
MKKFLAVFTIFAVLMFIVSCGSNSKTNDTTGTGETVTDEDSVDTDQTDTEQTENTDYDTHDTNETDTTPDNDEDTAQEDNDEDDDTPAEPTPDDDADSTAELTPDDDAASLSENDEDSTDSEQNDSDTETDENPCDPNPCTIVENSTNECIKMIETAIQYNYEENAFETVITDTYYKCGCKTGYSWSGSTCKSKPVSNSMSIGNICTGQDRCFTETEEFSCSDYSEEFEDFFGQDAQYAEAEFCFPHNFSINTNDSEENDDDTVIDNNTGLEWQRAMPSEIFNWDDAVSYCNNLTYAGHSDWRLPSPTELHTISDLGRHTPAFDTRYFSSITSYSRSLWTSQESKADTDTDKAYSVSYYDSSSPLIAKTYELYVMCVRGNELPTASFTTQTISEDIVVIDSATNLMWQKTYETNKTWHLALQYCENLIYAGYSDWRLPNRNELESLLDYDKSAAPYSDFPDMPGEWFWSSSNIINNSAHAWFLNFTRGRPDQNFKTASSNVRCVRNH